MAMHPLKEEKLRLEIGQLRRAQLREQRWEEEEKQERKLNKLRAKVEEKKLKNELEELGG